MSLGALAPADGVNLLLRRLQNFGGLAHALLHHGGDLGGGLGHARSNALSRTMAAYSITLALVGVISISWAR